MNTKLYFHLYLHYCALIIIESRMPEFSDTSADVNIKLKLLAGGNVVLVESRGLESEIFIPQLHQHRIILNNVISERSILSNAFTLKFDTSLLRTKGIAYHKNWHERLSRVNLSGSRPANPSKAQFKMKLISSGHVLLVECNGYESEIFMPHIHSHCLVMKSVLPTALIRKNGTSPRKKLKLQSLSNSSQNAALLTAVHAQANCLSNLIATKTEKSNRPTSTNNKSFCRVHQTTTCRYPSRNLENLLKPCYHKRKRYTAENKQRCLENKKTLT